jgi:hypothetical protein
MPDKQSAQITIDQLSLSQLQRLAERGSRRARAELERRLELADVVSQATPTFTDPAMQQGEDWSDWSTPAPSSARSTQLSKPLPTPTSFSSPNQFQSSLPSDFGSQAQTSFAPTQQPAAKTLIQEHTKTHLGADVDMPTFGALEQTVFAPGRTDRNTGRVQSGTVDSSQWLQAPQPRPASATARAREPELAAASASPFNTMAAQTPSSSTRKSSNKSEKSSNVTNAPQRQTLSTARSGLVDAHAKTPAAPAPIDTSTFNPAGALAFAPKSAEQHTNKTVPSSEDPLDFQPVTADSDLDVDSSGAPGLMGIVLIIWGTMFLLIGMAMFTRKGALYYILCGLACAGIGWLLLRCKQIAIWAHVACMVLAVSWAWFGYAGGTLGTAVFQSAPIWVSALWIALPSVRERLN